jgi:hypothetical protein
MYDFGLENLWRKDLLQDTGLNWEDNINVDI